MMNWSRKGAITKTDLGHREQSRSSAPFRRSTRSLVFNQSRCGGGLLFAGGVTTGADVAGCGFISPEDLHPVHGCLLHRRHGL